MEEKHPVQDIDLRESLDKFKEALKSGRKSEMEEKLYSIEEKIKQSLADKSRACMYLQQIIRAADTAGKKFPRTSTGSAKNAPTFLSR